MGKRKISGRREFSFNDMPLRRLKKGTVLKEYHAEKNFKNEEFVYAALINALADGDADAFKEILAAYLSVTNKEQFAIKAKIPKRTLFRMISPKGNPTLESIARIVHALAKAA